MRVSEPRSLSAYLDPRCPLGGIEAQAAAQKAAAGTIHIHGTLCDGDLHQIVDCFSRPSWHHTRDKKCVDKQDTREVFPNPLLCALRGVLADVAEPSAPPAEPSAPPAELLKVATRHNPHDRTSCVRVVAVIPGSSSGSVEPSVSSSG